MKRAFLTLGVLALPALLIIPTPFASTDDMRQAPTPPHAKPSHTKAIDSCPPPIYAGKIAGVITQAGNGFPVETYVAAYSLDGRFAGEANSAAATGAYEIANLKPGGYKLHVSRPGSGPDSLSPEWYSDQATFSAAAPITVNESIASGVNVQLDAGTQIIGQGNDLSGVAIYDEDGFYFGPGLTTSTGGFFNSFVSRGLRPGRYRLQFGALSVNANNSAPEWYDNKPSLAASDLLTVTGSGDISLIIFLETGATISGVVTAADTGLPLENVNVTAVRVTTGQKPAIEAGNVSLTDATGAYQVRGLPPGQYRVQFGIQPLVYASEYYSNTLAAALSTLINVGPAEIVAGIDASLNPGSVITGRVTDLTTGLPISNPAQASGPFVYRLHPEVFILDTVGNEVSRGFVDDRGYYTSSLLFPGTYIAQSNVRGYVDEWFNDRPAFGSADTVPLALSGPTTDINFALSPCNAATPTSTPTPTPTSTPEPTATPTPTAAPTATPTFRPRSRLPILRRDLP